MSGRTRSARALLLPGAVLLLAGLAPATASASIVFVTGPDEYDLPPLASKAGFEAAAGEANRLTVSRSGDDLVFTDLAGTIEAGPGCTGGGQVATCDAAANAPFVAVEVDVADGHDTVTCNVPEPFDGEFFFFEAYGGPGDDTLEGCDTANDRGADFLAGGTGHDTLRGRGGHDDLTDRGTDEDPGAGTVREGGNDRLFGGGGGDFLAGASGDDEVRGEAGDDSIDNSEGADGNDTYDGGSGIDTIFYDFPLFDAQGNFVVVGAGQLGAVVRLDTAAPGRATTGNGLPGESDTIGAIEDAIGSRGADQITGSAAGNFIFGDAGNDTIVGAAGNDNLNGGSDADTINSQDGEVDRVSCGGQVADRAAVDNIDQVSDDCPPAGQGTTVVTVPPPGGPVVIRDPRDEVKAVITASRIPRRAKTRRLRRTGRYSFRLTVNEVVTGEFSLSARLRGGRIATAGYLTLAERRRTLPEGRSTRVVLRMPRSVRRTLRKGKTMRLLIQLRDAGNNITSRRVTIKLT